METLWQELQTELATTTNIAGQIIARRSGHYIHLDQPELVIHAIRIVAETANNAQDSSAQRAGMRKALQDTATRFNNDAAITLMPVDQRLAASGR